MEFTIGTPVYYILYLAFRIEAQGLLVGIIPGPSLDKNLYEILDYDGEYVVAEYRDLLHGHHVLGHKLK